MLSVLIFFLGCDIGAAQCPRSDWIWNTYNDRTDMSKHVSVDWSIPCVRSLLGSVGARVQAHIRQHPRRVGHVRRECRLVHRRAIGVHDGNDAVRPPSPTCAPRLTLRLPSIRNPQPLLYTPPSTASAQHGPSAGSAGGATSASARTSACRSASACSPSMASRASGGARRSGSRRRRRRCRRSAHRPAPAAPPSPACPFCSSCRRSGPRPGAAPDEASGVAPPDDHGGVGVR